MTQTDITPTNDEISHKIESQIIAAICSAIDARFSYIYEEWAHEYPYKLRYDGDGYSERCIDACWGLSYADIVKQADEACRENNDVLALICKLAAYRYGNSSERARIAAEGV